MENNVHHLEELILDLLGSAEEVGVVLRESTHAGEAVELTALFVAIHGAKLCETQRQVAIGTRISLIYLAVVGAVHRLEHILLALLRGLDGLE